MGKYDLAYKKLSEIEALAAASIAETDYVFVGDVSDNKPKKVLASAFGLQRGATSQIVHNLKATVTLAQLNAGATLLADESGVTIRPLSICATAAGDFLSGTAAVVKDSNSSAITICTFAQANLTNGAKLKDGETGATRGAGVCGDLTAGKGIVVAKTGAAFTGGTSITFDIQYTRS